MSGYVVVIDVMLGDYLANFIGAFPRSRFRSRPTVHIGLDLLVGRDR